MKEESEGEMEGQEVLEKGRDIQEGKRDSKGG